MLSAIRVDPFATPDLVNLPELNDENLETWSGFRFDAEPRNGLLHLGDPEQPKLASLQPDFLHLDLNDVTIQSIESSTDASATTSDNEEIEHGVKDGHGEDLEDLWQTPDLLVTTQENILISWDHFNEIEHEEPACLFLSEACPAAFDSLLRKFLPRTHDDHITYVRADVLVTALFDLGLGRSSSIFQWNEQTQRFDTSEHSFTTSGLSQDSLRLVTDQYLDSGAQFRRLREFGQPQQKYSATRIAFGTVVNAIIDALENFLESSRHTVSSLLSLQDAYLKPFLLLNFLDQLVREVRSITDDGHIINAVLEFVERGVHQASQFESLVHVIITQMLQPILRLITADVGFIADYEGNHMLAYAIPKVLTALPYKTYEEAKNTLQILREHGHTSTSIQKSSSKSLLLTIAFDSATIALKQEDAQTYEAYSSERLTSYHGDELMPKGLQVARLDNMYIGDDPFTFDQSLFHSFEALEQDSKPSVTPTQQPLEQLLSSALDSDISCSLGVLTSCYQAIDLSISPLLRAQHRLLSYSALQVLFQHNMFVSHINLLGRFHLLIDGTFVSKLSLSLFDSEQLSGESRRRVYTKTGLRLENRDTWPPATSELRLALMGILSESMSNIYDNRLLDTTSFAIRDLSDEDLERCRDIDSIYALDFLRLNYKAPTTIIEAVITANNHEKYDRIFNQLLRLLRMQVLTRSLLRSCCVRGARPMSNNGEQAFRLQAQHFVAVLAEHYQNNVINRIWISFEARLQQAHSKLEQNDYAGTLELASGLGFLHELHEGVLDKIMRGLLLKRRQSEGKGIIDRLFEVILRFAALTSKSSSASNPLRAGDATAEGSTTTSPTSRLHNDFKVHMKALVNWLKYEAGRADEADGEMLEQLLLRLDWNGYWSKLKL